MVALLTCGAVVLGRKWPFTRPHVLADLGQASHTKVSTQKFRQTFFPFPGCVLENVTFRNDKASGNLLLTVKRLTIRGSYSGLLSEHVRLIRAEGAHATLPPLSAGKSMLLAESGKSHVSVDKVITDGAILDISSRNPRSGPLRFQIHKLTIQNPGADRVVTFEVEATNPKPPGEVKATFRMERWNARRPEQTRISGTYSFRQVELGALRGIAGQLSSEGRFQGPISKLEVQGTTDSPDFEVKRSGHLVHLTTRFDAVVNGTRGDVALRSVRAHWGRTTLDGSGEISSAGHRGRSASLQLTAKGGRIEDVLYLFMRSPRSPLQGNTNFTTSIIIPAQGGAFLRKVELEGNFDISSGRFTGRDTQQRVDKLSAQARGEKNNVDNPTPVLTSLRGQVLLKNGVAHFGSLRIHVPGAGARLNGTYGVENQVVNLHGMLYLKAKLSRTTSGIKAILLKPLEPFLSKNRHGGAKMPVGITGTYSHPSFHKDPI